MVHSLRDRHMVPEIMDEPDLDPKLHAAALTGLARVNWLSGSDRIVWQAIKPLTLSKRPLRLLDIATGSGDVPIRLGQRARAAGLTIEIVGADISTTALEYARDRANRVGLAAQFIQLDALREPLPPGFDIVTSSLFLHHLPDNDALTLLQKMRDAAGQMAVVNDLRRCRLGHVAAWLGTRVLTRSHVVHIDGPRSVAAAFTLAEVRSLADRAGWNGASLTRHWPWRFCLKWSRP